MREVLIGQFEHTIDAKGRINFPAKFREDMGDRFILTKGLDNCIAVYSLEEWERWEKKLSALPDSKSRQLKRFFFASATYVEPDKQGRVRSPANLREHAKLDKDVTLVGMGSRAEVWDTARWKAYTCGQDEAEIEESMELLEI